MTKASMASGATCWRRVLRWAFLCFVSTILWFGLAPLSGSQSHSLASLGAVAVPGASAVEPKIDPANVMGARVCFDCHRSEYAAWFRSTHYSNHEIRLVGDKAEKLLASKLVQKAGGKSLCITCHATPRRNDVDGSVRVISGVSCESCHGVAGGEKGWLNRHAVYGPNLTRMRDETRQHRHSRIEFCEKAGMIRSPRLDLIAKNCYQCHIVGNESLIKAGHSLGHEGFELISWIQGEVCHNFHMDQKKNAESPSLLTTRSAPQVNNRQRVFYVVAQLVKLELSLRNLAAASDVDGDYVDGMTKRAESAWEELVFLKEEGVEDADLDQVVEAVDKLNLGDEFKDQQAALKAANIIAKTVRSFAIRRDGSKLKAVDELLGLDPKGKRYQP